MSWRDHRDEFDSYLDYLDSEYGFEDEVEEELARLEVREEARRRFRADQHKLPEDLFPPSGWTLRDALAQPRPKLNYTIDQLHIAGGNTLAVAQYKAGKTTLAINLMKALADGEPFLGRFPVASLDGRVGYFNYELGDGQFLNWVEDAGIENPDRVAPPLQLRGRSFPLSHPEIRKQLINWLGENEVDYWILDPYSRASSGLVESEADNVQADAFLSLLDEIKLEAEVPDLLLTVHMGREQFAEGAERSRGVTRLEDWMDHGWYLTKDGQGRRSLRAMGRDVELEAIDLAYEPSERRLTASGLTRTQHREREGIGQTIAALVGVGEGASSTDVKGAIPGDKNLATGKLKAAAVGGFIERRYKDGSVHDESAPTPPGVGLRCYLTAVGREVHAGTVRRVDGNSHA